VPAKFSDLRSVCRSHLWSPSYFADNVGAAMIDVIRRCIESQDCPN
jgi:REP element-mobilizing transposase RayT